MTMFYRSQVPLSVTDASWILKLKKKEKVVGHFQERFPMLKRGRVGVGGILISFTCCRKAGLFGQSMSSGD